jgi:hypothetical protein
MYQCEYGCGFLSSSYEQVLQHESEQHPRTRPANGFAGLYSSREGFPNGAANASYSSQSGLYSSRGEGFPNGAANASYLSQSGLYSSLGEGLPNAAMNASDSSESVFCSTCGEGLPERGNGHGSSNGVSTSFSQAQQYGYFMPGSAAVTYVNEKMPMQFQGGGSLGGSVSIVSAPGLLQYARPSFGSLTMGQGGNFRNFPEPPHAKITPVVTTIAGNGTAQAADLKVTCVRSESEAKKWKFVYMVLLPVLVTLISVMLMVWTGSSASAAWIRKCVSYLLATLLYPARYILWACYSAVCSAGASILDAASALPSAALSAAAYVTAPLIYCALLLCSTIQRLASHLASLALLALATWYLIRVAGAGARHVLIARITSLADVRGAGVWCVRVLQALTSALIEPE